MFFALRELFIRIEGKIEGEKEKGQTLIEYALLVVLLAIVVIAALIILGPQIAVVFNEIATELGAVAPQIAAVFTNIGTELTTVQ